MLAEKYGVDREKAAVAAILHDCAKHNEDYYYKKLLRIGKIGIEEYKPSPIFHAYIGALAARHFFGISDEDILDAIKFHTTGRNGMSALEKVLFLADGIEPGREYDGLIKIRKLSMSDLDQAAILFINRTIKYLLDKSIRIDEHTLDARNFLIGERS